MLPWAQLIVTDLAAGARTGDSMAPSSLRIGDWRESGRHHDSDLGVPFTLQLSRAFSSADCNPVVAGTNAAFGLLGDNKAAVLHDRVSFPSPDMRDFLRGPIGSWHIS